LQQLGLGIFLDSDSLRAGLPWPAALEQALTNADAVVVVLGPNGLGGWQRREIFFALDRQVAAEKNNREYPVIPVLLKGADPAPSFLMINHGIDASGAGAAQAVAKALLSPDSEAVQPVSVSGARPYMGLHAFREEDSAFFFGRETFAQELFERLQCNRVVAAVGPSGSGKSSVVFGGLVPLLRRQRPPRLTWEIAGFRPGVYPWRNLADALIPLLEPEASETDRGVLAGRLAADLAGGASATVSTVQRALKIAGGADRLLLIVDQFEELFTSTPETDREEFISNLIDTAKAAPLVIVATLRADFYSHAIRSNRALSDLLGLASVNIGPLQEIELRRIIEGPALRCGAAFESALVDHIVQDVSRYSGGLPLLEYALSETWNRATERARIQRKPVLITLDDWHKSGELTGAIAQRADALFDSLPPEEQVAARRLFGALVNVAREGGDGLDTRRRASRSEIGETGWLVAQKFAAADYRLLVISDDPGTPEPTEPTVEVTHEAILTYWERLRRWVQEDRAALRTEQQVVDSWRQWVGSGRNESDLLEGTGLRNAMAWAEKNWPGSNIGLSEFLVRSMVCEGVSLGQWIPRYARIGDVMAIARPYLDSDDRSMRLRGIDVVRWIEEDPAPVNALLKLALDDPSAEVRRYAVEALCGMGSLPALKQEVIKPGQGSRHRRCLWAIAHARNVCGVGTAALSGLPSPDQRRASLLAVLDLISVNRSGFAIVFALASLCFSLAWDVTSKMTDLFDVIARPVSMRAGFFEFPFVVTLSVGLLMLLRDIIDRRRVTGAEMFWRGMAAGLISVVIDIVGRLLLESVRLAFGRNTQELANFVFAFMDQLPTILAMGIISLALLPAATLARGKTFTRRFAWTAFFANAVSILLGVFIIPLFLTIILGNYRRGNIEELIIGSTVGLIVVTIAATAGLTGFRAALRIAFDDRPYPEWPVPEPR
jgi:hypothetical protein